MLFRSQDALFTQASERRDAAISQVDTFDALAAFFAEDKRYPGWAEVVWSRPTGEDLDTVVQKLKALKLTIRNTPLDGGDVAGTCIFTGQPAVEKIYVARSY